MWEIVKRGLQRERSMAGGQFALTRRESVQILHNEIVDAFLKAGRQPKQKEAVTFNGIERMCSEEQRGMRKGIWKAVSNLGFAIAMAIRLLNPYVLITAAFGSHRSIFEHLSARVDSMRAVLSPRTGRRRRLTAWMQDTLPERHIPEAASAVWEDGSLLCGIVENTVSGACPGYDALSHPNTDRSATLWLGQKLVSRYLGVPPVFSEEELKRPFLTVSIERRLVRYLAAVRSAAARVEAEREKRMKAISASPMVLGDDRLSSDCIAQSAIHQEECMLECVARGMGLILGAKSRSCTFYLYLNPNHPHRHIHRLMQNSNLQFERDCVEGEAGAILMQIRGPDGDFGAALISTVPNSTSSSRRSSINLTESWCGRIPITYTTTEERVKVSYIPLSTGIHELSLLLRGGSHVPGSPFSVTVEETLRMPSDEDGNGGGLWKASSCDSGLNKFRPRSGSIDSDPGLERSWEGSLRQKKRVISRIVDFVSEKMILTDDGKLERMPRIRKIAEKKMREKEAEVNDGESVLQLIKRYNTTMSPTRSRIRLEELNSKKPDQKYISELDKIPLIVEEQKEDTDKKEERSIKKIPKKTLDLFSTSDSVDPYFPRKGPIDFRDHCRRILWLCDILLKYSPRQEGLEILNTAGDILGGKRVHPTIMEESEPEDVAPTPSGGNAALLAQRLQRTRTDSNGLNELGRWKEARRSLHTWSRSERSDSLSGGRLLHKGGSYRGIVVRDLNAEAITGAYAGGDDTKDDKEKVSKEEEEKMKEYLREGRPMPRKPHFSMRRRVVERTSEISGAATESTEQSTVPDAEKQPGMAEISGKDSNKHVTTKNTQPISYKGSKTETKGVESSGGEANKVAEASIVKSELSKEPESTLSTSHEKEDSSEVNTKKCDIEIKITAENDKQISTQSPEISVPKVFNTIPTSPQPQKQDAEVDKGMKVEQSLEEVKNDDSFKLLDEVKNECKKDGGHMEKESHALVLSPTIQVNLEENINKEPSTTIISTPVEPQSVDIPAIDIDTNITIEQPHLDPPVEEVGASIISEQPHHDSLVEKEMDIIMESTAEISTPSDKPKDFIKGEKEKSAQVEEVRVEILNMPEKIPSESSNVNTEAKETMKVDKDNNLTGPRKRSVSSYTHMISRMLCTESFPRESLEWFESEEKIEGAVEVEGTIEPMEDLSKTEQGSAKEAEPWGDEDTGLGFGLEEDVDPTDISKENYTGRVTTVDGKIPLDFTDPQPNQGEEENNEWPRSKFTETVKRSGVGVGVGVGVVIAGGIVSKEDDSSPLRKRDDAPNWWRRDPSRTDRMIEMSKQGSTERHWEAISTGIDAMEDGSIASIITGVVGGVKDNKDQARNLRRWSDSEEAKEDMGRKDTDRKPPREYGEERIAGHSITEIPREWGKGTVEHLQSGRVLKEEASGAFERRGVVKGPDSSREGGVRKKRDSEPRGVSIPVGEWWTLEEKVEQAVGERAWGGKETEVGKLGRRTPEEGVEVKEWEGACGGGSAPTERHKGIGGKEGPPSVSAGRTDDPHRTGERWGRGTTSREASLKHEKIERAEEAGEALPGAENSKEKRKRSWEKDRVRKGSEGERKGLKREEGVEMEDLKIKYGTGMDGRRKEKGKKPLSTGTEFSSESAESENKYSPAAIKESLRDGGEPCGRETKGGVGGRRKSNQVLVKSTKGVVLGSVTEGKSETSSQGAMEMGIEKVDDLLGSLIDIPKDNRMNEPGSSPKKVGEDMCGVRMSLDDWGRRGGKDNLGPETEVIVGEYEEVDEEDDDGGEKGEKCAIFKRDGDPKIDENDVMSEDDTPLLIMEETSGKRQYNFTVEDSTREEVLSAKQEQNTSRKGVTEMNLKGKDETEKDIPKEIRNPTNVLQSQAMQSHTKDQSASIQQHAKEEEKPKKKLIEPGKNEKVAERQKSVEDDDLVEEVPRESCETYSDFDYREGWSQRSRNNYPDLEELLGSDFSCKTTTYRAQFNLWPSEEAFGEKKVAEALESVLTGKSPMTGVVAGILGNPTHFSRITTMRSSSPNLPRTFEGETKKGSGENSEESDDDIEIVEQDFDDRSDEVLERKNDESDFIGFDLNSHPKAKSGDAFLIFESPGVTTYFPFEMEDPTSQKEGIELHGGWEEVTLFLDEDASEDSSCKITEVKEGKENETTTDDSSQNTKSPVLPAGRWSNRLSMSPAMSAISEEEAEEALPDCRDQRESSLDTGGEPARWDSFDEDTSESETNDRDRFKEEKGFDSATFRKLIGAFGPKIPQKEPEQNKSVPCQLPILPIEVEDGFGEIFTRRRSSASSVGNDSGDSTAPPGDCGAAFVVSSEIAVTLALGVSITQIIPPDGDLPPLIPQAEEGADAIAMEKKSSLPCTVSRKEQGIQTDLHFLETENKPSSKKKEEERGWILIDTTNEEKTRYDRDEGEDQWRVEAVGEVEEAASLTIAEESAMKLRQGYGGAIKKECRSKKAEGRVRDGEGSDFDSKTIDPIRQGMREFRKSGRDNAAKYDGNDTVKGKDSIVRSKWEEETSGGMNITGGDGNNMRATDAEICADRPFSPLDGERMENSEDVARRGKANPERSRRSEGEGKTASPPKCQEGRESERAKESHRGGELMVDKILEQTFGDKTSPNKKAARLGRRESVFDDYQFDLWEKGFELRAPRKAVETQDSTGLEYYLDDVEQLLNIELEATEQEIKYISAKEIMENFTKVIESPEKVSESTSSGEWSNTRGSDGAAADDLIDIASGSRYEKEGSPPRSTRVKNLLDDDILEGAPKSPNGGSQPRDESNKTIDDLLFGDEILSEPQSVETEAIKPWERKEPLKRDAASYGNQSERRNESQGKSSQQNRNWEEEHALAKKKREQTKRERSAENKSPKLSERRRNKNTGIFKTFDKSDENVDLDDDSKKDGSSLSFPKSLSKEEIDTSDVLQPEASSEEREAIERGSNASTSRDTYPSLTDSSGDFSFHERVVKENITPSYRENDFSSIDKGERIIVEAKNIDTTVQSVSDSSKPKGTKISVSERGSGIKPSLKEKLPQGEARRTDLDQHKIGKSTTKDEESGVAIGEREKSTKSSKRDKSDETKDSEAESRKGGRVLQESKLGGQSSSIDEYRRAVSEAYAFLDVQESLEGKPDEEPIKKKSSRRESVSWNAAVARVDSWDTEWSVISGAETGRMQETTGLDEITSSESSLSSPLSETRKTTTDTTESTTSSTKDTSTEETPDTRTRQKYRKSKDFDPDDEALFQAKMTVSSRKEYWDKRLEDMKNQSESVSSPPSRRPSKHSDVFSKGRMSFEQSSSATENTDSGKSSSESSPQEKRVTRQIASVQRKRESTKAPLTQAKDENREESDQSVSKTTQESSSDSDVAKDRTAISEISEIDFSLEDNIHQDTSVRQQIRSESQQKGSGSSSEKSEETKKVERKRSTLVENTGKMLLKACTSDDEISERKVPSIRVKGIVSRSKIELEKASSPPETDWRGKQLGDSRTAESTELLTDSSSPSEDFEKTKKVVSKNGESVMRLSKIFSSIDDEPSSTPRKDVRIRRKADISEETDSERKTSSSSEKGARSVPKKSSSESKTPSKVQEERIDSTSGALPKRYISRHAEETPEVDGSFVARRRKYWDAVRRTSLDTERREAKDPTQSPEKADVKKVRSMWERRASLDAITLTEERRRIGNTFFSESASKGRISVPALKEVSAERDPSPVKVSKKKETVISEPKPKTKTPAEKEVSEKKPRMHKSAPSTITPESQQGKPLAQSSVKRVKKVSSDKVKNEGGEKSADVSPSKAISSEKPRVVKKVSRSEIKSTEKDTTKSTAVEEKTAVVKAVSSEKKVIKKVIRKEKVMEEKLGIKDTASTEKIAEKVATSPKTVAKKTKPKLSPSPELKETTERKAQKDTGSASAIAKSEPQKEMKIVKKVSTESYKETKLMENTLPETQKRLLSESRKSATAVSPRRKESSTPKDPYDSDEERKATEYARTRKRRSSVEIRVTDDEDVCVMREITVIPVFPTKPKMETYEEEEEEGKEIRSLPIDFGGNRKEESPVAKRRSSLPPRSSTTQVSGAISSGKRRVESGLSPTKYDVKSSEDSVSKGVVKKKKSPLPTLEERLDTKTNKTPDDLPRVRKKSSAAGTPESKLRTIDKEYQRAELGEEGYAEKISATSARGERGDDGRTAILRRAAKGTSPIQKKKPPPSAASSPDSEVDSNELPRSFLSAPTTVLRRHSAAADSTQLDLPGLTNRRSSGDVGSPRKSAESKKRFSRAKQFFENMEKGKDSPPGDEVEFEIPKSKKKKPRGTATDVESMGKSSRKSSSRRRSPLRNLDVKDDSESTPDSDKQIMESDRLQQRRRSRRGSADLIHSAPGSDVENPWENPQKSLQRRKKGGEPVLRSQMFGGSERQPRVSERFNVMDLFKDVAGAGTGGSGDLSGRVTPLGIPHQAAVLAALRSVEDVRSSETRSPYDLYKPVEAVNDCVPSPSISPDVNANEEGGTEEGGTEEGHKTEDDNDNYESSMTLHSKREYQAEYPHLPITSPRRSRHRSSNVDLIPRNVLLKLDNTQSSSKTTPSRTRSQAELF